MSLGRGGEVKAQGRIYIIPCYSLLCYIIILYLLYYNILYYIILQDLKEGPLFPWVAEEKRKLRVGVAAPGTLGHIEMLCYIGLY